MEAITRFLTFISDNWTALATILLLIFGIYAKAKKTYEDWQKKTEEEKEKILQEEIERAKKALAEFILSLVAEAEVVWKDEGSKLGAIKRAQVISEIFDKYPVLSYVADQEELLAYIDEQIDKALVIVREKIREQAKIDTNIVDDGK